MKTKSEAIANIPLSTATAFDSLHVRIKATAQDWQRLMSAKQRANAAQAEAKALEEAMGIPSAETLAKDFSLPNSDGKASIHIVDGNGFPLGKMSVYWWPGSVTSPGYRKRIS